MVYVDPVFQYGGSATFRWRRSCHMYADTVAELHALAARVGMKRAWFQDKPGFPHYDLTEGKRWAAIRAGACAVASFKTSVKMIRLLRASGAWGEPPQRQGAKDAGPTRRKPRPRIP